MVAHPLTRCADCIRDIATLAKENGSDPRYDTMTKPRFGRSAGTPNAALHCTVFLCLSALAVAHLLQVGVSQESMSVLPKEDSGMSPELEVVHHHNHYHKKSKFFQESFPHPQNGGEKRQRSPVQAPAASARRP